MMKSVSLFVLSISAMASSHVCAQSEDAQQLVEMIKKNLASSTQNLRNYEWLETTNIYLKGELKTTRQNQCYYSVDNKLTKVPTAAGSEDKQARGLRGRIVENKKEEMSDYAEKCVDKIQRYLPPASDKLQAAYAGGRTSLKALQPGKVFELDFTDYYEKGDLVAITVDKTKALLTNVKVGTSVTSPSDKIDFSITYNQLPDGTQYPAETILNMPAKEMKIVITHSGYKKAAK